MAKIGMPLPLLAVVGDGARSDAWVQINADVFGIPVRRPKNPGAGMVAEKSF